jgi:hypothetical protein
MEPVYFPEDVKKQFKYAIEKAREDRPAFFAWLQYQIAQAVDLINTFDKIYLLGGLGVKLIKSSPTMFNQLLEEFGGEDEDDERIEANDEIEVLLEYLLSIATASGNTAKGNIPTEADIQLVYERLSKIKSNMSFWELSAEVPVGGNEFDHWLRTNIMHDTMHVRGYGYHTHIHEAYSEIFAPHSDFLEQAYGFNAEDLYRTIQKLDGLVYSKVGTPFGATQSHQRLTEWMEEMGDEEVFRVMEQTGKHFIQQFTEANPDLSSDDAPDSVVAQSLDNIEGYKKLFWVIPKTDKEEKIFQMLSQSFGDNAAFFEPAKFKAFPLNDSRITTKPLVKEDDRYYSFSLNLAFRNIFKITEDLIKTVSTVYYDNSYKGNSNSLSRDNYIELKTKALFERIVPNGAFYRSLKYDIVEGGMQKRPELDILGISGNTIYIIEVKAGELNSKHRRGALQGLKDRISETITEGSYQCHRALTYILNTSTPTFDYSDGNTNKTLTINKSADTEYVKVSVTFEHFSSIAANLKYLIGSGILSPDYKWTWIVSMYDLMVFADLMESESDFKEYLHHRIGMYERDDVVFEDEVDILGYFIDGNFPITKKEENEVVIFTGFASEIDAYYTKSGVGLPYVKKPTRKRL